MIDRGGNHEATRQRTGGRIWVHCLKTAPPLIEAQEVAIRSFPAALGDVDPQWLTFTIAVRYKSTGQRDEVLIAPKSWGYVTAKLQPYRCIDIHVVPKSAPPSPMPSSSSSSSSYAPLYPETPPSPPAVPLYQEQESKYANAWYYNSSSKLRAPPYTRTPSGKDSDSTYFDLPPPKYPGSPGRSPARQPHPLLEPSGYGYGFGWGNQIQGQSSQAYFEPILSPLSRNLHTLEEEDTQQTSNRRSMGWSASSVRMSSPDKDRDDRPPPVTITTPSSNRGNLGLFSSIRHRMFPIAWAENRSRTRRRRRPTQAVDIPNYDRETEYDTYSSSGRSYVPSLI
ncbi:hypothetical protein Clacol_002686 [Clathrus columnatus]|uniref:Uncharacterized protein n=1 Tax=Clathrus columnatus TaxID=1419009 RepID=A0AAV5A5I6_9AGAM|nr:hypothetical protein Clacol_002686 [Clathrus columnatus]